MDMKYEHKAVEPKWQEKWEEAGVFHAVNGSDKPKYYALIEFCLLYTSLRSILTWKGSTSLPS